MGKTRKKCSLVYLLSISNVLFCGLLFVEYMVKFDYIHDMNSYDEPTQVQIIHIINATNTDSESTDFEPIKVYSNNRDITQTHDGDSQDIDDDMIEDMINWSIEPYSLCYIFNKNKDINDSNRIALVTVSDLQTYPHPKSWLPLARMNRLLYARAFSYDYCDFPRDWDFTTLRETRWVKFGALYTVLKYYKFIVWLDTDTLFWNSPRIPFQRYAMQWFTNHTNLSVLFSNHGKHSESINAGIFIIKNTQFSFNFLEKCYSNYVNKEMTLHHADQDAFQHWIDNYNQNNEIMVIHSKHLQRIYVQIIGGAKTEKDYKRLYEKQWHTIIFHRVGGGEKKYFQMNDVIMDWMDREIIDRIRHKCAQCFGEQNKTWHEAVRGVNMHAFNAQEGNKIVRLNKTAREHLHRNNDDKDSVYA